MDNAAKYCYEWMFPLVAPVGQSYPIKYGGVPDGPGGTGVNQIFWGTCLISGQ